MRIYLLACLCLIAAVLAPSPSGNAQAAARPPLASRQYWGAQAPIGAMTPHTPRFITIHHTAVPQKPTVSLADKMKGLQRFSQQESRLDNGYLKKAWPDVPYHFYVDVQGDMAEGRDPRFVGDTNTRYDPTGHIAIVLEGNFEIEFPSASQLKALISLVRWLMQEYQIPIDRVKGHGDYAATACPGRHFPMTAFRDALAAASP